MFIFAANKSRLNMIEEWNKFVFDLIEAKNKNVEEDKYHALIEAQLQLLGWAKYKGEICHKPNIPIGNREHIQPDILIKKDDEDQFVIEVKRPVHTQTERERLQLESYMRQLKVEVGIYIGESIEIFYDGPKEKSAISIMQVPIELDNKLGAKFVEKFSKASFSRDTIISFCEDRIKEMQHLENLNKIKETIIADPQSQITECLKSYLIEKYNGSFTEEDIKGMLATLSFSATPFDSPRPSATTASISSVKSNTKKEDTPKRVYDNTSYALYNGITQVNTESSIPCFLECNAVAKGIFFTNNHSLLVLKGSKINPHNSGGVYDSFRKKRDQQLTEYTEVINGERIVKENVLFKSPSGAANFCIGRSSNGWKEWKDNNGNELGVYR